MTDETIKPDLDTSQTDSCALKEFKLGFVPLRQIMAWIYDFTLS